MSHYRSRGFNLIDKKQNPTGFTLIELLMVVAIITVLLAISIPALHRVKIQARGVMCRSNLRQIGMAAGLYAEEYDFYIPRGMGSATGKAWFQLFMPFLSKMPMNDDYRSVDIFRCPDYPDKEQTVCYVVNGWDFESNRDMVGKEILTPSRLNDCNRRASTLYLVDNEDGSWRDIIRNPDDPGNDKCDIWTWGHLPSSDEKDEVKGRRVARSRHRNGTNCLFLDWHVEWMDSEDITIDMWRFKK